MHPSVQRITYKGVDFIWSWYRVADTKKQTNIYQRQDIFQNHDVWIELVKIMCINCEKNRSGHDPETTNALSAGNYSSHASSTHLLIWVSWIYFSHWVCCIVAVWKRWWYIMPCPTGETMTLIGNIPLIKMYIFLTDLDESYHQQEEVDNLPFWSHFTSSFSLLYSIKFRSLIMLLIPVLNTQH